ncbi:pepsin/retropepsin-like aspartic protease family protein [Arcticibacter tournemirensis]
MCRRKYLTFLLITACSLAYGQDAGPGVVEINHLLSEKSFIKANELYKARKKELPAVYQCYVEASLNNAFNRLPESESMIDRVLKYKKKLPDSLMVKLLEIKKDNTIKLYQYKEAAGTINTLLKDYSQFLTNKQRDDLKNDFALWSALANTPAQTITIKDNTILKIVQDKAGLKNIKVTTDADSVDFIFDTGANISTISRSVATKMGMKLIDASIKVGAITGKEVSARLALCDKLLIGNMQINNAVFLVFDDADLAFPQIGYHINGILGFPVIEAMKEITLTKDGYLTVPKKADHASYVTNMAMDQLIPLLFIKDNPFTFDTGADNTILFRPYFLENREAITGQYQPETISFGGAGGAMKYKGYKINASLDIAGRKISLKGISLVTDDMGKDDGIFGNIGQDVIKQFQSMTLNFKSMFIHFQ